MYFTGYRRGTWLERQKYRLILGGFGLFIVSMAMSCQEFIYMASGKTTDAHISTRVDTVVDRYGNKEIHRILSYTYFDNGVDHHKYIRVPLDWEHQDEQFIKVQYIPGRDTSRIYGESNMLWVYIFFGTLGICGVGFVMLMRGGG